MAKRTLPAGRTTPPPIDYDALTAQLISQLAGPLRIQTPQLGEVEQQSVQNTAAALAFLRLEAARAAGIPTTGVFTVGYCRGLSNGGSH